VATAEEDRLSIRKRQHIARRLGGQRLAEQSRFMSNQRGWKQLKQSMKYD